MNMFLHFDTENLYQNFIVKECQILKVLVNTYYILMRINKNSNYIVKLLSACICYVVYLLKGKSALERIRLRKYFLKLDSSC